MSVHRVGEGQMEHPSLERNIGWTGKVDGNIEI